MNTTAKDLTKEAPASPNHRTGGYVILSRLADKARAEFLGGKIGDYHTDCALDHILLDFKGVKYDAIKQEVVNGASDLELAKYLDAHGKSTTPAEIEAWSNSISAMNPYQDPEKGEWYKGEAAKLGLDASVTPMLTWLDVDDQVTFRK